MLKDVIIGLNVGTLQSEGVAMDTSGQILLELKSRHNVSRPYPGWAEHDAEDIWWADAVHLLKKLVAQIKWLNGSIVCVGCSGLYPDVLPVDSSGHPLRPAILYGIDSRASKEIEWMNQVFGTDSFLRISGNVLSSQSVTPKILWLARHEPHVFRKTYKVLSAPGFLVLKLTGRFSVDHCIASGTTGVYDSENMKWDWDLAEDLEISPDLFPDISWASDVVGFVSKEASEQTGLPEGTPVVAGTGNTVAQALSGGVSDSNDLALIYGSTMNLILCSDERIMSDELFLAPYCIPGKYTLVGGMTSGEIIIKWFCDNFGRIEREVERSCGISAWRLLDLEAEEISPGSEGLVALPYLSGERTPIYDEMATGAMVGLTPRHTRAHVFRAWLEAIGYGVRHNIEAMGRSGVYPRHVVAMGDGTTSHLWTATVSDIANIRQEVVGSSCSAAAGAAFLAGYGAGVLSDIRVLKEKWVSPSRVVTPDPKNCAAYQKYYRIYAGLYNKIKEEMHSLRCLG
mgnify:CR=1 FL=1